ncbi:MAG: ABC transporter ATP-binding protein [Deltaproteobacteria bacterium]|nr:ABC transporter ATP-binding protein [Deltaproteobacteria bacterium]
MVLRAENLVKTFKKPFQMRSQVRAVRGLSLDVLRGEIFGFVGPNGAGKTTTIKMMMGLIFPTSGRAFVLGEPVPSGAAKTHVGFLPENPYFYDYLTALEFLDLVGRLFGLPKAIRRERATRLLERVGLARARDQRLRTFSKGMLQRLGLAQALVNDPKLVVLDEPMSGLDPIGRKEVRDLIIDLKNEGRTVFFSTHILSDVELICDRVAIIIQGEVRGVGALESLLSPKLLTVEVVSREGGSGTAGQPALERDAVVTLPGDADVESYLKERLAVGARIVSVIPRRESLEDVFVREAMGTGGDAAR